MQNKKNSIPIYIDHEKCIGCNKCVDRCRRGVLTLASIDMETYIKIEFPEACTMCKACEKICPTSAIEMNKNIKITKTKNMKTKNIMKKILHAILFLAIVAAVIAIVMLLWNALIPQIIGWSAINYWQAAGLLLLCKLLFGGLGRGGHHHWKHRWNGMKHKDMHIFRDKMKGMSHDERREYIRQRMTENFGHGHENHEHSDCR